MDKSLLLNDDDPHVECGEWYHIAEHHVPMLVKGEVRFLHDHVYFYVRVNPAGLKLMMDIDSDALFHPTEIQHLGLRAAIFNACLADDDLVTVAGLEKFRRFLAKRHIDTYDKYVMSFITEGMTCIVTCHEDSPLFSWFLVLGGTNG
jgi:hypothetical protein